MKLSCVSPLTRHRATCNAPRMAEQIISSGDAARILSVHPATLIRWIDRGEIRIAGRLPNGMYLFNRAEVERFAAERVA